MVWMVAQVVAELRYQHLPWPSLRGFRLIWGRQPVKEIDAVGYCDGYDCYFNITFIG